MNPRPPTKDETARFSALALPHTDAAYNLALRLTRQAEAAEDVTHDAFVSALAGFAAYRGGDARAWILTIVRRKAYDWLRARARVVPLHGGAEGEEELEFDMADPDQESPEQALIRKGEAAGVHAALDCLPPRLREVLVLREMEELSYREIAEVTDAPIGSVMSRLARARGQLAEAWRRLQGQKEGAA
ncbi:sigma-70 family RNA polymerase sigma factor [Phenylobacterium montanum]|uniref:Sigma-70 family RNA polymerase sigma factor n=1 Tax=Phenylobacterium montanum TaxID=2823693 RepID=A0A975FY43_9CAUL|nr:sigma-70 family RNA polymerase sigma factor [Caulobacter sp. S6]QUD87067.1 sigma-70 family RNA polymerase sigma factor [Caulobacter sp. S6]